LLTANYVTKPDSNKPEILVNDSRINVLTKSPSNYYPLSPSADISKIALGEQAMALNEQAKKRFDDDLDKPSYIIKEQDEEISRFEEDKTKRKDSFDNVNAERKKYDDSYEEERDDRRNDRRYDDSYDERDDRRENRRRNDRRYDDDSYDERDNRRRNDRRYEDDSYDERDDRRNDRRRNDRRYEDDSYDERDNRRRRDSREDSYKEDVAGKYNDDRNEDRRRLDNREGSVHSKTDSFEQGSPRVGTSRYSRLRRDSKNSIDSNNERRKRNEGNVTSPLAKPIRGSPVANGDDKYYY